MGRQPFRGALKGNQEAKLRGHKMEKEEPGPGCGEGIARKEKRGEEGLLKKGFGVHSRGGDPGRTGRGSEGMREKEEEEEGRSRCRGSIFCSAMFPFSLALFVRFCLQAVGGWAPARFCKPQLKCLSNS